MQVVSICVPELEQVRVAQILTISSELAQAYKWAMAVPATKRALNRETRFSLLAAARFSATDYLQARPLLATLPCHCDLPCCKPCNVELYQDCEAWLQSAGDGEPDKGRHSPCISCILCFSCGRAVPRLGRWYVLESKGARHIVVRRVAHPCVHRC